MTILFKQKFMAVDENQTMILVKFLTISLNFRFCEYCGRTFITSHGNFDRHIRSHKNSIQMEEKKLEKHKKDVLEKKDYSFPCSQCDKSFALEKYLNIHIRSCHGKFECQICGENFEGMNYLVCHKRKVHNSYEKPVKHYECSVCPKKFRVKADLSLHMSIIHEKKSRKTCPECGKLVFETDLKNHLENYHGFSGQT